MQKRIAHTWNLLLLALAMLAVFPVQFRHAHHDEDEHHTCETIPGDYNWEEDCSICDTAPVLSAPLHFASAVSTSFQYLPHCLIGLVSPDFTQAGLPDYRGPPTYS
jgi:hypothetical protein